MPDGLYVSGRRYRSYGGDLVSKVSYTAEAFKDLQDSSHDYIADSHAVRHGKDSRHLGSGAVQNISYLSNR